MTQANRMQTASRHPGRSVVLSLAIYLACALATHASGLWQPMHADYSCWLRVARDWSDGAALYCETYDNKSPWVYRWVRALDSARPEVSCYLAESILAAAGATLFSLALRPSFPRIAPLVGLLAILWTGTSETFYGGQTTEAFAVWWDVAAISCFAIAAHRGSARWAFVAGACLFLVAMFRPPAILHVVAWLPLLWLAYHRHAARVAWRISAAAGLGWLAMLGLLSIDAFASDWGREWPGVLVQNARYGRLVPGDWARSLSTASITVARILLGNPIAILFLFMAAVVWWRPSRRVSRPRKCWLLAAVLWSAAVLVNAWPGGRHYAHYYHFGWPPVALLASWWLCRSWDANFSQRAQRRLIIAVAVGSIAVAVGQQSFLAARTYRDRAAGHDAHTSVLEAASFLQRATDENTPLVAHLWLDGAELYWRVPRPSPSFAIPHVLPRHLFDRWAEATLANPPAFIVWDGTPWQGIDGPADPRLTKRIETLLARDYYPLERFGTITIFSRNAEGR